MYERSKILTIKSEHQVKNQHFKSIDQQPITKSKRNLLAKF